MHEGNRVDSCLSGEDLLNALMRFHLPFPWSRPSGQVSASPVTPAWKQSRAAFWRFVAVRLGRASPMHCAGCWVLAGLELSRGSARDGD